MVGGGGGNAGCRMIDGGIFNFSISDMARCWVIMRMGGPLWEQVARVECRSRPLGLDRLGPFSRPTLIQIMFQGKYKESPPSHPHSCLNIADARHDFYLVFIAPCVRKQCCN